MASQRKQPVINGHAERDRHVRCAILACVINMGKPNVIVSVDDGFVVLKGEVPSYRQKERLHRFVMHLSGVRALKDLISIQPTETLADRQIGGHVRQALEAHAELPLGTVMPHVHHGVVTLTGHVRSAEERFIAEHVASHCRGVVKVINELTVNLLDEVTDEATARAVRGALDYCEGFGTDAVMVSCADGEVCLRGRVTSLVDRGLAEELARAQAGVRSVENLIVVRPEAKAAVLREV
jgi:osmotically-inducible protein OsmY